MTGKDAWNYWKPNAMNPSLEQEQRIFQGVLELESLSEREAFLETACSGNPALRASVNRLLAAHAKSDQFFTGVTERIREEGVLSGSIVSSEASEIELPPGPPFGDEQSGTIIGQYKVLEKIGEGGCGVVYMAEQQKPIRRRVALKIIKLGMDTKAVIARFEQERQALALMDHPNIARVLDAGATETGRPYFVMELVHGIRITDYSDQHQLGTRERLELFVRACHAIQHAHQKGVIHRDVKPSNILVTLHDGVPVPKVIDFGIAKATGEERLTERTLFTSYGHFIGTPAYMSPEQAEMSGLDVDTRSDIYSLGVLLYELLTGKTPFDQSELLKSGLDQMRRTLQEEEPHRPSTKLKTLHATELTRTALQRHTEPPKLRSELSGDLDWIAMKALEKDRSRRYETANGLAMDVERHLNNEPVTARPPSQFYRFRKLVRRNRVKFVAMAAVLATLISGFGTSTWLFLKEREARHRAVAAEQKEIRLRNEAEMRQKLSLATKLLSREKIEDADWMISGIPVPEANLEYAALFRTLGDWNGTNTRWKQAADRFAVLVQMSQPEDWDSTTLDYLRLGPVLIESGDTEGYERFRRAAIAHYANTTNPLPAERVVKISLLTPADQVLMYSLRPLAELASDSLEVNKPRVEVSLAAWRSFSIALMQYRQGQYKGAIDWCERSIGYQGSNPSRTANVNLVSAMSHVRLGQADLARAELNKSRDAIENQFKRGLKIGDGVQGFWFDWVFARILLREAVGLIEENPSNN